MRKLFRRKKMKIIFFILLVLLISVLITSFVLLKFNNNVEQLINENGEGLLATTSRTSLEVGDYVNYTYDTASAYSLSASII